MTSWINIKSQNSQQKAKADSISDEEDPFREIAQEKSSKKEGKVEKVTTNCQENLNLFSWTN